MVSTGEETTPTAAYGRTQSRTTLHDPQQRFTTVCYRASQPALDLIHARAGPTAVGPPGEPSGRCDDFSSVPRASSFSTSAWAGSPMFPGLCRTAVYGSTILLAALASP